MNIPSCPPPTYKQSVYNNSLTFDFTEIKNVNALIHFISAPQPTSRWDISYLALLSPEIQKAMICEGLKAPQVKSKTIAIDQNAETEDEDD